MRNNTSDAYEETCQSKTQSNFLLPVFLLFFALFVAAFIMMAVIIKKINETASVLTSISASESQRKTEILQAVEQITAQKEKAQLEKIQQRLYKGWDKAGISKDGHYMYGSPSARFTLINYEDLECPFCKRFMPTPKKLVDSSTNGAVNWIWRHFPVHGAVSRTAGMTAECIAQQKGARSFWAVTDYWFSKTSANGQGFSESGEIPDLFEADRNKFEECMADHNTISRIKDDIALANKDKVSGTPTTIIRDNLTGAEVQITGAQPEGNFVEAILKMAEKNTDDNNTDNNNTDNNNTPDNAHGASEDASN